MYIISDTASPVSDGSKIMRSSHIRYYMNKLDELDKLLSDTDYRQGNYNDRTNFRNIVARLRMKVLRRIGENHHLSQSEERARVARHISILKMMKLHLLQRAREQRALAR